MSLCAIMRHMATRKNIKWDEQPLGIETDCAIAERLGVSSVAVKIARDRRGVAPAPRRMQRKPKAHKKPGSKVKPANSKWRGIWWDDEARLGKMTDCALAKELGVLPRTVYAARTVRGIPRFCQECITGSGGHSCKTEERVCACGRTFTASSKGGPLRRKYCSTACTSAANKDGADDVPLKESAVVLAAMRRLIKKTTRRSDHE